MTDTELLNKIAEMLDEQRLLNVPLETINLAYPRDWSAEQVSAIENWLNDCQLTGQPLWLTIVGTLFEIPLRAYVRNAATTGKTVTDILTRKLERVDICYFAALHLPLLSSDVTECIETILHERNEVF